MIYFPGLNLLCLNIAISAFFKKTQLAVDEADLYNNWYKSLPIVGQLFALNDDTSNYFADKENMMIVNTIINIFGVLPSLWQCPLFNSLLLILVLWNMFIAQVLFLDIAEVLFTLWWTTMPLELYCVCALGGFIWALLHFWLIIDMMKLHDILEGTAEMTNNDQNDREDEDIYGYIYMPIGMLEDGLAN